MIMKKQIILIILLAIVIVTFFSSFSYAKFTMKTDGKISTSIAKPICRATIKDKLYISNYQKKPLEFEVYNYDENEKITDVAMEYKITIEVTQENAPLNYKLFRIYLDGSEEEVNITKDNNSIYMNSYVKMNSGKKETHKYRLETEYNNSSSVSLDYNIGFSLRLNCIQSKPQK